MAILCMTIQSCAPVAACIEYAMVADYRWRRGLVTALLIEIVGRSRQYSIYRWKEAMPCCSSCCSINLELVSCCSFIASLVKIHLLYYMFILIYRYVIVVRSVKGPKRNKMNVTIADTRQGLM